MTTAEAIKELQKEHDLIAGERDLDGSQFAPALLEALDMATEALEKQIPKKAELDVYDELICPVCGSDVEWKRYCEECGQRIDTGDES